MELSSGRSPQRETRIAVSPRKARNALLLVIAALTVAGVLTLLYVYLLAEDAVQRDYLVRDYYLLLDPRGDLSIHDWFSTVTLFGCGLVSASIAANVRARRRPYLLHWVVLSLILIYLSADEAAALHERVSQAIRDQFEATGWLEPWVVPAVAISLVYGYAYARFVLDLPRPIRILFVVSVVVLIVGGIGFDVFGSHLFSTVGIDNNTLGYALLEAGEQLLEMLGAAILLYALLEHLAASQGGVRTEPKR